MKSKCLLIFALLFIQNILWCQQKIVPFYFIVDGDSVKINERIKLLSYTGKFETLLVDGKVSFKEPDYNKIENITLIVDTDTLNYFNSNESNPLLKQVALNNFKCFFEYAEYWVLFIDKYPFQLDGLKFMSTNNNLSYYSLNIKGCVEEIVTLKK